MSYLESEERKGREVAERLNSYTSGTVEVQEQITITVYIELAPSRFDEALDK